MKSGRFSNDEMLFIEANAEVLSIEEIASQLNRDPASVKKWISKKIGFSAKQKKEAAVANELKSKPYYKELKHQFAEEELEMFEFHFKKMWSQFKDDVFHTEEMQIIDTIKLEILMNRILKSQQDNQTEISTYERLVQEEKARKATMLKDLKGTREQRIKAIEDSKQTFASLVKQIATDSEFRTKIGLEMEKMRLSMESEKERLAEYHEYEDGTVDQPFLTSETLIKKEDE